MCRGDRFGGRVQAGPGRDQSELAGLGKSRFGKTGRADREMKGEDEGEVGACRVAAWIK
jgi:hypothetical protein